MTLKFTSRHLISTELDTASSGLFLISRTCVVWNILNQIIHISVKRDTDSTGEGPEHLFLRYKDILCINLSTLISYLRFGRAGSVL